MLSAEQEHASADGKGPAKATGTAGDSRLFPASARLTHASRSEYALVPYLQQLWFDDPEYLRFKPELLLASKTTMLDRFSWLFTVFALSFSLFRIGIYFGNLSHFRVAAPPPGAGLGGYAAIPGLAFNEQICAFVFMTGCLVFSLLYVGALFTLREHDAASHSLSPVVTQMNALALAWIESPRVRLLFDLTAVLSVSGCGFDLLAAASTGSCLPDNAASWLLFCTPDGSKIPPDRVILAVFASVFVQAFMPAIRVRSILLCWALSCVFVLISTFKADVPDYMNVIGCGFCIFIILQMDEFGRDCFALHLRDLAVQEAERKLEIASSQKANADLEIALLKAEKSALETNSKAIRSIMGNVAHDLKTPIQSITIGLDLLRFGLIFILFLIF